MPENIGINLGNKALNTDDTTHDDLLDVAYEMAYAVRMNKSQLYLTSSQATWLDSVPCCADRVNLDPCASVSRANHSEARLSDHHGCSADCCLVVIDFYY